MQPLTAKELIELNPGLDLDRKNILIEEWADLYFTAKGKRPASADLVLLADWILEEDLKDTSRTKVQDKEFPILSKPQIERRYRELALESDIVDVLHLKKMGSQPTRKKDNKNNEY